MAMAGFEPRNRDHAIIEVVFGITFSRPFTPREIEAFANTHSEWKSELPRLSRSQAFELIVGNGSHIPELPIPSVSGVLFDRIKPDGNVAWRLAVEHQMINVHCLDYTRWQEVWPVVQGYFQRASSHFSTNNSVSSYILQYVDMFDWVGERINYDISSLFELDSELLPKDLADRHSLWHLHQGWFSNNSLPAKGRLLERIHIDAAHDQASIPFVKTDTYMQMYLEEHLAASGWDANSLGNSIFETLHMRNKELIRRVLSPEMSARIGLN